MKSPSDFILTLMTNDLTLAQAADRAGVNRIGIDIERIGKQSRQGHLKTWISHHKEPDLAGLRENLYSASLFARCNPIHAGSQDEIERLINAGASTLMLPYFKTTQEVEQFIRWVDGRAHPVLLLETKEAAEKADEFCKIPGVREIHIGLNDMRLSLGWPSHFHVLASPWIEPLCARVLDAGHRLGIGGMARVGDQTLPVPTELVAARIVGLGARASLISRAFFRDIEPSAMDEEIASLRNWIRHAATQPKSWHADINTELQRETEHFSPS
jgi:hypothetical protein